MVKHCSPFKLSGVVDSSFSGSGGGAGSQVEAPETTGLRSGELRDVTQAGAAARLVISLKAGTSLKSSTSRKIPDVLQIRAVRLTDSHHRRLSHGMHNEIVAEQ